MNTDDTTAPTTPVVLAHGAWADGSSWSRVIRDLHDRGVRAYAVPLPLTSLGDDVDALERVLERVGEPALVVGHAYAGAVIQSAAPEQVRGLVYVAALAPDEGETVADVFNRDEPHASAPALTPDGNGLIWLPDEAFPAAFAQDATAEEHATLASVQRPIAIGSITTPVRTPAWRTRPAWYFLAESDRMIPPKTQRFMAERMGATVRSAGTDHAPLITASGAVTDLIMEALKETARMH